MTSRACILIALAALASSPAAMAEDSMFLSIDHAGPITWERIKVFDDQIYFYQRALGKLTRFDAQGNTLSVFRFADHDVQGLLPAADFAAGAEGEVFFAGRTRNGGFYLLALFESGETERLEMDRRLDIRKVAVPPDGTPVLLGWDEVVMEAVKSIAHPNRASPLGASVLPKPVSILHRCDPHSRTIVEMAHLPPAPKAEVASKNAWSLYVTPFAADSQGNVYFSTGDGQIHTQPPRGVLKSERLPPSDEELQLVHNILAHPDGNVLVAVHEGPNAASEEDKAQGMIAVLSPNMRIFAYAGKGFEEIHSGNEVHNLLGVFSDGAWVIAFKKRTSIDLSRFEPPRRLSSSR